MLSRRTARSDRGFTLIELTVTMVIIGAVLLGLITIQSKALSTVGLAKQRQTATELVNRYMERLRALPYNEIAKGLDSTDLAGDTNITGGRFKPAFNTAVDDLLVVSTTATPSTARVAPLYPHIAPAADTTTVDKIVYDVRTYVSAVNSDAVKNGYWLTAVATWKSFVTKNKVKSVALRSTTFSPNGCLSPSSHPFSGPCQSFLYGVAGFGTAGFTLAPAGGTQPLDGLDVTKASVTFGSATADTVLEQVQSAIGKVTSSGAQIDSQLADRVPVTSTADTDPTTGALGAPTPPSPLNHAAGTLTASGSGRSVFMGYPADAGDAYATTVAVSGGSCKDDLGTSVASNQLCASGALTPSGAASATVSPGSFNGRSLGSVVTASLAAPAVAGRIFSARYTSAGTGHCSNAATTACVASTARRSLGTFTAGDLPAAVGSFDVVPSVFTHLVTVSNVTQVAGTEAGPVSSATSVATRTGTASYWNGTGYTSVTLGATAATYTQPAVSGAYYKSSGSLAATVTVSGTLRLLPSTTGTTGDPTCSTECVRSADSGDIQLDLDYVFVGTSGERGHFTVSTILGSATVSSTYKAAPVA